MRHRFLLLLAALVLAAGITGPANSAVRTLGPNDARLPMATTSQNWSGYDVTRRSHDPRFKTVTATWVQPAVDCSITPYGSEGPTLSYAAFWVGLDGDGSDTVEQIGTEADCVAEEASYTSWFEMYPAYPVDLDITVNPGDVLTAKVTYIGRDRFALKLINATAGQQVRVVSKLRGARRHSAEVIAEAPFSPAFGILPLAAFGTVIFTSVSVDGRDPSSYQTLDRIDMIDPQGSGTVRASTSPFAAGAFGITWVKA